MNGASSPTTKTLNLTQEPVLIGSVRIVAGPVNVVDVICNMTATHV